MVNNRQLMLYDHPDLKKAAAGANAKELGNRLIFLKKASGRAKIDLLVALSNCADEAIFRKKQWRRNPFMAITGDGAGGYRMIKGRDRADSYGGDDLTI
jgi:phage terminase large subunit-like protein